MSARTDQVESFWEAFSKSGPEAFLALLPEDVEWRPLANASQPLHGAGDVRDYFRTTSFEASLYGLDELGRCVLARATLRRRSGRRGLYDSQPTYVYFYDGEDRLRRAQGFHSEQQALEAIDAWHALA